MVPANKILTVAYGTFSCTLEGFDDPFAAMTDVAEYFRDLAADDRFFGAEPPTPDLAMLRTIAEARGSKAVEAIPDEGGIVLRSSDAAMATAAAAAAAASQTDDASTDAADDSDPSGDDVLARLARIRGVVEADRQSDTVYTEDEHVVDASGDDTLAAAFAESDADVADQTDADQSDVAVGADEDTDAEVTKRVSDEEIAEISALIGMGASEDDAPLAEEIAAEETVDDEIATPETMDIPDEGEASEAEIADLVALDGEAPSDDDAEPADIAGETSDEAEAAEVAEAADETTEETTEEETAEDDEVGDAQADEPKARTVRVRKIRRVDTVELVSQEDEGETSTEESGDADDTPADEFDELMAELATIRSDEDFALEDEMVLTTSEGTKPETSEDDGSDAEDAASEDDDATVIEEPDMERLFAATDSRLSGEDASRRHANISHLKAAVAARRADGPVDTPETDDTDAYRADLADSVRPRAKVEDKSDVEDAMTEEEAARPSRSAAAPLMLVSEQRVEKTTTDSSDDDAVRETVAETVATGGSSTDGADFEAFAAEVGARELADVLEAAAVFSERVLGQDDFTRPRLLHLAAEAFEDLSREDGLRGFGALLRDGTIRKVGRGTFALAGESRYAESADRRVG